MKVGLWWRRRRESSTDVLEKGKPDLVKSSNLNADSHLRRSALYLVAASTIGLLERSSTIQNGELIDQGITGRMRSKNKREREGERIKRKQHTQFLNG